MEEKFCEFISESAIKAMLYEVSATPKPGLVDRGNSGAHRDMDFYTFMASSAAIGSTFYKCALSGMNFSGSDFAGLLDVLRPIGKEGEKKMYEATGGVNTHKGLIFSLGIISSAAGTLYSYKRKDKLNADEICKRVMEITIGISDRELCRVDEKACPTYGERLFKAYGSKGIRGEVESGFPAVRSHGLPVLKELMASCSHDLNNILVHALLSLMTVVDDSNVLGRHDPDTLEYVKKAAKSAFMLGGMFSAEGRKRIEEMDREFISRYISPGGSADLLAVTIMLFLLENTVK